MQAVLQREHQARRAGVLARATRATALTAAAIAALAIASLIHGGRAAAQWPLPIESAPAPLTVPLPVLPDNVSPFAFGFLVFDWDPAAPGGVPGFDVWPPGSRR